MGILGNLLGGEAGIAGTLFGGDGAISAVVVDTCWNGTSSSFEARLLAPDANYAIEQFRLRFLNTVTTPTSFNKSARAVLQMALETELSVVLTKLVELPIDVLTSKVCERRRYLEVDFDMRAHRYLIGPFLREVAALPDLPASYVDMMRRYAGSAYPRYRMAALAAALCVAVAVRPS